jgi:hypothetical protein
MPAVEIGSALKGRKWVVPTPQSLSQLSEHFAFGPEHREPLRWRCILPLQGFQIEGATLTQAVGLGFVRAPLSGVCQDKPG